MSSTKQSLYDPAVAASVRERLERLTPTSTARWGEMSIGQMLAHCADAQDVLNGKPLTGTPWWIRMAAPLIKPVVLSKRPFPRGLRTHPQYEVRDERPFAAEKQRLLRTLDDFEATGGGLEHDLFGHLSANEVGWLAYKHLDHHLRQFGV
ncbi:MAG: DUF1569 domain-containing protein [Gemmatimonadales bacterium]|jgi:hypothetical protein